MRLLSVTVLQRKAKYQLAQYFYSEILGLPRSWGSRTSRRSTTSGPGGSPTR
jgi:hypothetical protein